MMRRLLPLLLVLATACSKMPRLPRELPIGSRGPRDEPRTLVEIRLSDLPVESPVRQLSRGTPSLDATLRAIEAVAERSDQTGLFLRIGPLGRGSARADDLVAALSRVRAAHEPVHCHFELADNLAFYLMARGCDRISMTPAGHLALTGVAAQLYSIRGLLTWAGISVDAVQAGSAKGAADPFTRDEPTPEHRENVQRLVDAMQARLAAAVREQTGGTEAEARAVFERAPFTSNRALAEHLVDAVEFDDEAREHARVAARATRTEAITPGHVPPRGLTDLISRLTTSEHEASPEEPHLVVARLCGSIVDADRPVQGSAASEPFVVAMRRFADQPEVKAVVLRIDSPGGSALASDRMWHAIRLLAQRKPVVASIGDTGASGGYYVASAATEVFAGEASIVGSIGVVAGRPNLAPLLERFGVRTYAVLGAPSADVLEPFRALRADELTRFEASAQEAYGRFLSRVRAGRGIDAERLERAAEGRIFTGAEARELGLVSTNGGLSAAIARARSLGHLSASAPTRTWPPSPSILEAMLGGEVGSASMPSLGVLGTDAQRIELLIEAVRALEGDAVPRAALPYVLEL